MPEGISRNDAVRIIAICDRMEAGIVDGNEAYVTEGRIFLEKWLAQLNTAASTLVAVRMLRSYAVEILNEEQP